MCPLPRRCHIFPLRIFVSAQEASAPVPATSELCSAVSDRASGYIASADTRLRIGQAAARQSTRRMNIRPSRPPARFGSAGTKDNTHCSRPAHSSQTLTQSPGMIPQLRVLSSGNELRFHQQVPNSHIDFGAIRPAIRQGNSRPKSELWLDTTLDTEQIT